MEDPSISAAFADTVALRSPQLVGQAGIDLQRTLTEIGERDIWLHHPDCLQFFELIEPDPLDAGHIGRELIRRSIQCS